MSTHLSDSFAPATDREHPAIADRAPSEPTVSTQVVDASTMPASYLACHANHIARPSIIAMVAASSSRLAFFP